MTEGSSGPAGNSAAAARTHDAAVEAITTLREAGATVATAESVTGGLVAAALTSVPGASWVVLGGVVAYARVIKTAVLHVDTCLLERGGAVQAEVARQMAAGVRHECGAEWGVSTTGVAGPEPSDGKSVGTVYVGISGPDGDQVSELTLRGDRDSIRAQTVAVCLDRLTERVRSHVNGLTGYR